MRRWSGLLPGLLLSLAVGTAAVLIARVVPTLSAALIAILLGAVLANTPLVRSAAWDRAAPGIALSAKQVLRLGIVLLGLQLALGDVLALGVGPLVVVIAVVATGMGAGLLVGRLLRLPFAQTVLVASGFSICGAAAVAATAGALAAGPESTQRSAEATSEDETVGTAARGAEGRTVPLETQTATAVALVVVFGTLMIPLVPLAATVLGLDAAASGTWAGASVLEVAQVVAAGGLMGTAELEVAVLVKLARVLMLAPVIALLTVHLRRLATRSETAEAARTGVRAARPPLVPLFIVGFLAAVVVRSLGVLPVAVLDAAQLVQAVLLAAAMFALGTGVRVSLLRQVGGRPILLAGILAVVVLAIGLAGAVLLG